MNTLTTLAAHVGTGPHSHGPGPFIVFPILWFLLIVGLAVAFLVVGRRRLRGAGPAAGRARLAERFAAGEIDADEYRTRLAVLTEKQP